MKKIILQLYILFTYINQKKFKVFFPVFNSKKYIDDN